MNRVFDIQKAKEICDKATPGPWIDFENTIPYEGKVVAAYGDTISEICQDPDLDDRTHDRTFIAEARTLLPEAIAEIERLRNWLEEIKAESVWGDPGYEVTLKNKLGRIFEDVERVLKGEPIE